jgi:hypothetical protein
MKKIVLIIVIAFQFALIWGCASPNGNKSNSSDNQFDTTAFIHQVEYLLPSPGEIFAVIHDVGLNFNPSIIRPIEDNKKLTLYRSQGLNFGIYLSDFSYLLLFEKQAEAIKYLYQIQDLASMLGVENFFDDAFFNQLLNNLNNPDSLKALSIEQSSAFFSRMESTGNKDLILYVTSGAMIEIMYIALNEVSEKELTEKVTNAIIDLAYLFDTFYLYYATAQINNDDVSNLNNDLKELRNIFNSLAIQQTTSSSQKDGRIVLNSTLTHKVDVFKVKKMKDLIDSMRNNIVNQGY